MTNLPQLVPDDHWERTCPLAVRVGGTLLWAKEVTQVLKRHQSQGVPERGRHAGGSRRVPRHR